jgi:hypothetical protein
MYDLCSQMQRAHVPKRPSIRLDDQRPSAPLAPCSAVPTSGPCLTSGPTFVTLPHGNARFWLQTPGQRPGGPKAFSYQSLRQHLHRRLYTQYARCLMGEAL